MKRSNRGLALLLALLVLAGGALVFLRCAPSASALFRRPDPQEALGTQTDVPLPLNGSLGLFPVPGIPGEAQTANGRALLEAFLRGRTYELLGPCSVDGKQAEQRVRIVLPDLGRLGEGLADEMTALLSERVAAASRAEEIYENGVFRGELVREAFDASLGARLAGPIPSERRELVLRLSWTEGAWRLDNADELAGAALGGLDSAARADELAEQLLETASAQLPYLPLRYRIAEDAVAGQVPDPDGFGQTSDPAVIEELLRRPEAQALIGGQELVWNADLALIPDTPIRYYLDESLLVLVWQEEEAHAVGTFAEVFVSDGSQLLRKIAGDEVWSMDFQTTSDFARSANAVLTVGGDFYYHGRNCGINFFRRGLIRFEPDTCNVCYFTADGDMLFSYRGQYQSEEEVRRFAEENDVVFSLGFGPVLIDDGVDVTPEYYLWGEVNEEYARSAIGLLGRHHYLTMNINCGTGYYYYLATLRQAADAMVRRGCIKAYTLDGGQTATTVFGEQLVNPVQFGWEKQISDVLCFVSAVPAP